MLKLTATLALMIFMTTEIASARMKVIYGADNRTEVSDAASLLHQELAKSTAAMVDKAKIRSQGENLSFSVETLQEAFNVCPSEPFYDQPAIAHCSGFLVGPDLLVTAGHCVVPAALGGNQCERFSWVFDYRSDLFDGDDVDASQVYNCEEVLVHALDPYAKSDYALIRLDRPVTDRQPLQVRQSGQVETGTDLVVIGHPSGLPTKIAAGATVLVNSHAQYFESDLDTYGGNSGSAVLDAETGLVEGILVRGATDYLRTPQGCIVSNRCDSVAPGRCGGESVSRISLLGIEKFLR